MTSPQLPTLLAALAGGGLVVEASFVARLDGDVHGYVFVFEPQLGARPGEKLAAALDAANLRYTAGVVGQVRRIDAADAGRAGGGKRGSGRTRSAAA